MTNRILPTEEDRRHRDEQIARFAQEFAGTELDLDEDLMEAGLECLANYFEREEQESRLKRLD